MVLDLIVDLPMGQNEPFHYDSELNLLLSDWWHTSAQEQQAQLSSIPNRWVGPPQSFLINGRGQYNCSLAASLINTTLPQCKFEGGEECAPQILHVDPNKTYRIRIASSTSLANLNFAIANHKMVVVEADGNYEEPFIVDDLDIYSGETYSVIITTNENPNQNYWISVGFIGENLKTPQALTILNYKENNASVFPTSPPPITPQWDDYNRSKIFSQKILARKGTPRPPIYYDRRLLLLNTESLVDGRTMYAINNVTLILPSTPYLVSIKYKLDDAFDQKSPPDNFSFDYDIYNSPVYPNSNTGSGIYMFQLNQVVDVVLQNTNILERIKRSDFHPWHLHGHDFWILGYGDGMFKPGDDETKFNLENPPLRNNAVLFPYGWTALRFKANNPGVWAFHCHVEPHLHMGMGVVFAEAVENVEGIPWETLACGLFRGIS